MTRSLRDAVFLSLLPVLSLSGCGDSGGNAVQVDPPNPAPGGPPPMGPGGGSGSNPAIKEAMVKLGRGPNSLTPTLGKELKETPPPWDAIGPQASEYAKLTASIVGESPTRGDKESWSKLAKAYADSAAELDKAAQARDVTAALAAHGSLTNSCMACHRVHRAMGPGGPGGRGGPGGPPGGPGGPPPGGGPPGFGPPPGGGPPG